MAALDLYDPGTPEVEDVPAPPQTGIPGRKSYAAIRNSSLPTAGTPGIPVDAQMMRDAMALKAPPASKENVLSGTGRALASGAAGLGADVLGAAEYGSNQILGDNPVTSVLHGARTMAQASQQSWIDAMSPQEKDMMARQWTTLDPHKTIWQGGAGEFVHTVALHAAEATPATLAMLWPAGRLAKLGMTNGAIAYVGATQAALSTGAIANNIADDITNTPEAALRQNSPWYAAQVDKGMDPAAARAELITKTQGFTPVIAGLATGAIATVAGRFLSPVLTKEGASLGGRLVGGAADQAIQGGASSGADYVARESAAHTYDKTRMPDWKGGAEAVGEGAASGAIQGAGFGVFGHHNQPAPEAHATATSEAPINSATGPAETHTNDINGEEPIERNREGHETMGAPSATDPNAQPKPIDLFHGQGQLDLDEPVQGVPADQAAALKARQSDVGHWAEPETPAYQGAQPDGQFSEVPPPAQAPGMFEPNGPQQNLDLQGGQMNAPRPGPTPPVAAPGQMNLPLQERMRGARNQPPVVEPPRDMSEPPAAAAPKPAVDVNQPDLFNPDQRGSADQPSAEPFGDLAAQLRDLQNPDHPRGGVYLSADNLESLRKRGLMQQVQNLAGEHSAPLPNFDGKGGALIAKTDDHAAQYQQMRDQGAANMQEILGHATGAGEGKPETGKWTVQQHDEQGNVTRETVVNSQAQAKALSKEYSVDGRTASVTSTPAAILRRARIVGLEQEQANRSNSIRATDRDVSRTLESDTGGNAQLSERARGATRRDLATRQESVPVDRPEAARRLTAEARKLQNETTNRSWKGLGAPDPRDVHFSNPAHAERYARLDEELAGAQTMVNTAKTPEERAHAEAGRSVSERRIATFLKTHTHETHARQVGKAALHVEPEAALEYARDKTAPGKEYVKPEVRLNPEHFEPTKGMTRAEVSDLSYEALDEKFAEATSNMAGDKTPEELRETYGGTRSEMEKLVNRYERSRSGYEATGFSNAKSDKMAVSPKRALTEKEEAQNRARTKTNQNAKGYFNEAEPNAEARPKGEKHVGFKTVDPKSLMATVESQREMESSIKDRKSRNDARIKLLKDTNNAVKAGEKAQKALLKLKKPDMPDGISPAMARGYMAQLLQYGRSLRDHSLRGTHALAAAKQFAAHMEFITKKEPVAMAKFLHETYKTELAKQDQRASYANPRRMENKPEVEELRHGDERLQSEFTPYQLRAEHEASRRDREEAEARANALGYNSRTVDPITRGARAVSRILDDRLPHRVGEILPELLGHLEPNSPMHKLFSALHRVVDSNTVVGYAGREAFSDGVLTAGHTEWHDSRPVVRINRGALSDARADGRSSVYQLMHTLGHELTHVATSRAIEANPAVRQRLEAILAEVRRQQGADAHYGARTNNVREMVAEAYSNPKFQKFLDGIRVQNTQYSMWSRFKQIVSDVLGFQSGDKFHSALDAIMREHGTIFTGKQFHQTPGEIARLGVEHLKTDRDGKIAGDGFDRVMQSMRINKDTARTLLDRVKDMGDGFNQAALGVMTPRQQWDHFAKHFQRPDGTNPYDRYWRTYFKRASDNAIMMEHVGKLSNAWSNFEDRVGPDAAHAMTQLMHDSTLYQFHPDKPLTSEDNEHLTTPEQKARYTAGADAYARAGEEGQEIYRKIRDYYADGNEKTIHQIVLNGLHAMLTKGKNAAMTAKEFDSKYTADTVKSLDLTTHDGLEKEFGDKLSGANVDMLAKMGTMLNRKGPYFPLMRNGDYITSAKRTIGSEDFATGSEAHAYAREQRAKDPTWVVNIEGNAEDGYTVSTVEREVRMAETKSAAARNRKELAAQYGEENTNPVQLKADLFKGEGSITTGSTVDRILGKLDDNPAAQAAIKDFYLRSLGEAAFRKRELQRSNVRGVDPANQHRSFTQYGRSQSYYLSQLRYGRHLANAQGEVQSNVRDSQDTPEVSALRKGEIARELALRDEISRNPQKVSEIIRKGTSLTQFMMLTSPSNWLMNAAQPYTVSTPWLGARHGYGESLGALGRAQKLIASPLLTESAESWGGLKTIFGGGRAAAEKSFSVLDQIMSHISDRAGAEAKPINAMLQHLRNNNLIDLSMATELSDISKGKDTGLTARVLDASRTMMHLVEVNNRVGTAIAARELALKKGMTEAEAVEHASQAVAITHNDYSHGNTARMFMAGGGALGGVKPLLFQFMKYTQQMYGLLISNTHQALKGASAEEKAIGLKTVLGILGTHMLAAGAVGATIQPIKWAIGGAMAMASSLGLTDDKHGIPDALSGDTYDHMLRDVMAELFGTQVGELVSKGVPAALGGDMSQRMALGSMYNFHMKTDSDASLIGSIAQTFGGPWLNVASNFYDAGQSFLKGDPVKAITQMTPHILRDFVKAADMSNTGIRDNAGRTTVPAEQITAPQVFLQSMGIRPSAIAERSDASFREQTQKMDTITAQRALIQKFINAEPIEQSTVRQQITEFNGKHPGFPITQSSLFQARARKMEDEREMQSYGVRGSARQRAEVSEAGSAYNK